ncbi:MAG: class I SAM-dependent methyltransferase [Alphaproteobacteria bacterium]|nr:class I SAM-dependent methyltransferase [Alphaproteobacteria bacterium]
MTDWQAHWDRTYSTKAVDAVSWYQAHPERSLALIRRFAPDPATPIIDVGGGASRLIDLLVEAGYGDLAVLDVSRVAVDRARARLGAGADRVHWIVADVGAWTPPRRWQLWHDRAVFHFFTETPMQEAYLAVLAGATAPGATVILATFALDGPERCSGLPVQRYSAATLAPRLGPGYALLADAREVHETPAHARQNFIYAVFHRQ